MSVARDVSGRQLMVGQTVAYCLSGKSQCMRVSKVTHVRKNTVELEDKPYDWSEWGTRRNHAAVCIIE